MRVPPIGVVADCPVCGEPVQFVVEVRSKAWRVTVEPDGERPRRAYLAVSLRADQVEHECPDGVSGEPGADTDGDTGQTG